ncbi:MAG: hypothetical protein HYZ89_02870 [Candidatus Omnitrophica bacterium]|nr:hypothetical protein [Candidatus Omnitrophota bacterium]
MSRTVENPAGNGNSRPGDVILDPFMGGATTLVEARAMGRHAVGSDISTLSVFLSRVKTTPLGEDDLRRVAEWTWGLPEYLNLHLPPLRAAQWHRAGYQRHLPWPIRKTIEFVLGADEGAGVLVQPGRVGPGAAPTENDSINVVLAILSV